eukprot:TRINITY_DN81792_c0_g1_i1.p1 TRINITY_DN81792_c0_g1~~TRINITY_DN81792_c0_g1_i1.p1  ORF type:complete len:505 (-),score=141.17 TRINITY_DN81792_c0_g1_i1:177-1664(-)
MRPGPSLASSSDPSLPLPPLRHGQRLHEPVTSTARAADQAAEELGEAAAWQSLPRRGFSQPLHRLEERLEVLEGRLNFLQGPATSRSECFGAAQKGASAPVGLWDEVVRLQNELDLGLEELREQLSERLRSLQAWQDSLEAEVRRSASEALQTCNRLADDSLSISEATQVKMQELQSQVEEELRRAAAEVKEWRSAEQLEPQPLPEAPSAPPPQVASPEDLLNIAGDLRQDLLSTLQGELAKEQPRIEQELDAVARQLSEELGGQISRLGGAMRRIVRVLVQQQQMQQQFFLEQSSKDAGPSAASSMSPRDGGTAGLPTACQLSAAGPAPGARGAGSPREVWVSELASSQHKEATALPPLASSAGPVPAVPSSAPASNLQAASMVPAEPAPEPKAASADASGRNKTGSEDSQRLPPPLGSDLRHRAILDLYEELQRLEECAQARELQFAGSAKKFCGCVTQQPSPAADAQRSGTSRGRRTRSRPAWRPTSAQPSR